MGVDRDRLAPVVLALLAVVALGAAAATLNTAVGGDSIGSGGATGPGSGEGFSLGTQNETQMSTGDPLVPPWLLELVMGVMILLGLVGVAYLLYREGRTFLYRLAVVAAAATLFGLLLNLVLQGREPGENAGGLPFGRSPMSLPGGSAAADATPEVVTEPPVVVLLLAAVVVAVLAAVVLRSTGDDEADEPVTPEPEPAEEPSLGAVGDAAGRAADRIEDDVSVSNAVYDAWRDMTGYLDVSNPDTSTPGEFADAAVAAGMRPDDVRELTELFETTRYGGAPVDDERADRAVRALRRIEDGYADADPDESGGGGR